MDSPNDRPADKEKLDRALAAVKMSVPLLEMLAKPEVQQFVLSHLSNTPFGKRFAEALEQIPEVLANAKALLQQADGRTPAAA